MDWFLIGGKLRYWAADGHAAKSGLLKARRVISAFPLSLWSYNIDKYQADFLT